MKTAANIAVAATTTGINYKPAIGNNNSTKPIAAAATGCPSTPKTVGKKIAIPGQKPTQQYPAPATTSKKQEQIPKQYQQQSLSQNIFSTVSAATIVVSKHNQYDSQFPATAAPRSRNQQQQMLQTSSVSAVAREKGEESEILKDLWMLSRDSQRLRAATGNLADFVEFVQRRKVGHSFSSSYDQHQRIAENEASRYEKYYGQFLKTFLVNPGILLGIVSPSFAQVLVDRPDFRESCKFKTNAADILFVIKNQSGLNIKQAARWGLSMRNMNSIHDYYFQVYANILDRREKSKNCCIDSRGFACPHPDFSVTSEDRAAHIAKRLEIYCFNDSSNSNSSFSPDEANANKRNLDTLVSQLCALSLIASAKQPRSSRANSSRQDSGDDDGGGGGSSKGDFWARTAILNFGVGVSHVVDNFEQELDNMEAIDLSLSEGGVDERGVKKEETINDVGEEEEDGGLFGFDTNETLQAKSDQILKRLLNEFDNDRLLQASLNPPMKDIGKIRVSNNSYNIGVGSETTPHLLQLFNQTMKISTKNGTHLPPSITLDQYNTAIAQTTDDSYTFPKHIYLLKTVSFANVAAYLNSLQIHRFKQKKAEALTSQQNIVKMWAKKAVKMIVEKNSIWTAWRVPSERDMLNACDGLMERWVEVCQHLVVATKKRATVVIEQTEQQQALQRDQSWRNRWNENVDWSIADRLNST
ncbi:hypothetical protein HK100_008370, partial [Physocladia obscura]